jgi:hypothetical protein
MQSSLGAWGATVLTLAVWWMPLWKRFLQRIDR